MSEDAIKAELLGVKTEVQHLRREGDERGKKLDSVLNETTKIKGRVTHLETTSETYGAKIETLEKRAYQIGFLILALHGGARELITLFF